MTLAGGHGFNEARDALINARRDATPLAAFPESWQPGDVEAAWALQRAVVDGLGTDGHAAWKVAGVTDAQRAAMRVDRAVGASIPAGLCVDASSPGATFSRSRLIAPLLECEFAYRLGRDLPPRSTPWTRDEVEAAIASMHLAIELVDTRLPRGSGTLAEMADGFNNGALVIGGVVEGWRHASLASVEIRLDRMDTEGHAAREAVATGSARAVLDGDPLGAVVQLANAQPAGGPMLRAGDVITTGSCTGAPPLPGLGRYRACYSGLGAIEITIVA